MQIRIYKTWKFDNRLASYSYVAKLGECIALWDEPNELSIQYRIYIFIQYVDS